MQSVEASDNSTSPKSIVPLRTILRNFLNLVESYETRRNGDVDLYEQEFQELKQFSESLKSDSYYQCKEGERSVNRKKNRYKDILPFDYSRVTLSDVGDIPGSDYTNANFIKGASGSLAYIACQGPLPHTVNDFWRMVIESEVQVIVMACMEQESGKHKCENYWVEDDGVEREFGVVTVWLKKCRNVCSDFLVRTMRIRFPNKNGEMEERNVCQFHYSAWPDHGIPTKVRPLLDMVRLIRDCQTSETLPVLVHCSAGCGRTGTICAIDYVWGLLRLGKLTEDFSLFNLVREMRRQRIAMVQTKDQYILVHRAVKELFQEQLKIIDAHPYANVDQNGLPVELREDLEEPTYATIDYQCKGPQSSRPSSPLKIESLSENNNVRLKSSLKIPVWKGKNELDSQKHQTPGRGVASTQIKKSQKMEAKQKLKREEDMIGRCATNGEDTVDCSNFSTRKTSPPAISPNRGASILRKPSIVKLRALFEKSSKHDGEHPKKANITINGLSRAKSDVTASSRFYSFAASFSGSKSGDPAASSASTKNTPKPDPIPQVHEVAKSKQCKPPILAKTAIAVKRSKSLKIHPEESPVNTALAGTTEVGQDPIKVCVKQTEMPKLQRVSSSTSSRLLSDIENPRQDDYVLLKPDSRRASRRESLEQLINGSTSEGSSAFSIKPALPAKSRVFPAEIQQNRNRSPELDNRDKSRWNSVLNAKENDGVTPRSAVLVGSVMAANGCLTRSQSHVWQPVKTESSLTARIFSNEDIYKSKADTKNQIETIKREQASVKNQPERIKTQNGATSVNLSPILGNPIARRRLPKISAYSNYPVETNRVPFLGNRESGNASKGTPPFVPSGGLNGNHYTSDSSNSLPSTPTQSIDRRNPQSGTDSPRPLNHQTATPRPILKGSLSSTPSDSDELLDSHRPKLCSTTVVTISSNNPNVNNIASISQAPLGSRERRNSFRQAVWKEVQNETQQDYEELPPSSNYANSQSRMIRNRGDEPLLSSHRTHKDYEPIWPHQENRISPSTSLHHPNGNEISGTPPPGHLGLPNPSKIVKSRINEFNGLLDELKEPPGRTELQSSNCHVNSESKKSPNLKYHRSLKAPSRLDYEQSHAVSGMSTLSCFTFKKPTSLESITDQIQSEDRTGKKSAFSFLMKDQRRAQRTASSSASHGFHSGRYASDYVTLEQCRTDSSGGFQVEGEDEVDTPTRLKGLGRHHHTSNGEMPIPPPRTKSKKLNQLERSHELCSSTEGTMQNGSLNSLGSKQSNGESSYRVRMKSGDSSNPASPISTTRTRAFGIFQDMKSKIVNWTEPLGKERTQSQCSGSSGCHSSKRGSEESNGSGSSGIRDPPWSRATHTETNEGISNASFSSGRPAASRSASTSKHQYL